MEIKEVLPKDAIPSIDDPDFDSTYVGSPDEQVIVLESDPTRAYPIRILHYHEIVNDTIDTDEGDVPVVVTWCPLCGSAIVYERTVNGQVLSFGVSGKLADDDLVMYDRETGSEWKQSRGQGIAGPLEGEQLTIRPAAMMDYETFRREYPNGIVLRPPGGQSEVASDDDEPARIDSYDRSPYEHISRARGSG